MLKGNLSKSVQYKGPQKWYSYIKCFGAWHNQSKTWEHGKVNSGSKHQLVQNQLANIFIDLLQKGATTMKVYEDGVNIMFKSCFSKMEKLQLLEYGVFGSSENQLLSKHFYFLLQPCLLPLQRWFWVKLLILSADTDMLGLSPFDVAVLFVWTPSCTCISFTLPL